MTRCGMVGRGRMTELRRCGSRKGAGRRMTGTRDGGRVRGRNVGRGTW